MTDCPGRFKCHGPASWCDECGDVDLVCDDPRCEVHLRGPELVGNEKAARYKMDAAKAEFETASREWAEASMKLDRYKSTAAAVSGAVGGEVMLKDFADLTKLALAMIVDPEFAGKTWGQVVVAKRLNRNVDVDGDSFCCSMRGNWIYANLAALILAGNYDELKTFIDYVDPQQLVRQSIRDREKPVSS